jgi:hypothetical protein
LALIGFGPVLMVRGSVDLSKTHPVELGVLVALALIGVALVAWGVAALRRIPRPIRPRHLSATFRQFLVNIGLVAAITLFLLFKVGATTLRRDTAPDEHLFYLPGNAELRVLAGGYREALADLIWVSTVSYFGEHLLRGRRIDYLERYLEAVIALDPKFRRVYKWGGTVVMYNLRTITRASVEASTRVYEAGRRRFPNEWEFPFRIGINYYFELQTDDEAERKQLRRIGAKYVREASLLPGAPAYLAGLAAKMYSKWGQAELARAHLEEVLVTVKDPRVREYARTRLADMLKTTEETSSVERPLEAIAREQRKKYPFLGTDLYLVLKE